MVAAVPAPTRGSAHPFRDRSRYGEPGAPAQQLDPGDRQRRHAVPARLGPGGTRRARHRHTVCGASHIQRGARCCRTAAGLQGKRAEARHAARELHPYPYRARRRGTATGGCCRSARGRARGCPCVRSGLAHHDGACGRCDRRSQARSAAAHGRGGRRGDRLPGMAHSRQLHLSRRSQLPLQRRRRRAGTHIRERAGSPALARREGSAGVEPAHGGRAAGEGSAGGAHALDRDQVIGALACASP